MKIETTERIIFVLFAIIILSLLACLIAIMNLKKDPGTTEVAGEVSFVIYDPSTGPHIIRYDTATRTLKP